MCNSGGSVCRRCISKESESVNMKLREQLLACGFDGDERRLQALLEWLHGEDVSCLGHLVGAPPVHEIRGANAFQEEDLNILKEEVLLHVVCSVLVCCSLCAQAVTYQTLFF